MKRKSNSGKEKKNNDKGKSPHNDKKAKFRELNRTNIQPSTKSNDESSRVIGSSYGKYKILRRKHQTGRKLTQVVKQVLFAITS